MTLTSRSRSSSPLAPRKVQDGEDEEESEGMEANSLEDKSLLPETAIDDEESEGSTQDLSIMKETLAEETATGSAAAVNNVESITERFESGAFPAVLRELLPATQRQHAEALLQKMSVSCTGTDRLAFQNLVEQKHADFLSLLPPHDIE